MQRPLVEIKDATFQYPGSNEALVKGVNFTLYPGQRVGVVGDNGSGKSTIAKLLLGLHTVQKGSVHLFGERVSWRKHYPWLSYIGDPSYAPGRLGLPTGLSVRQVVDCFQGLWNTSTCLGLEDRLGLNTFFERDVGNLSKGQRMKLMAFLALSKETHLLIADEPTEGLDERSKEIVISEVERAAESQQFGMLWISHKRFELAMLTQKTYHLSEGDLLETQIEDFDAEVEVNFKNNESQLYRRFGKDGIFDALGKLVTDSAVSSFKITGTRKNDAFYCHESEKSADNSEAKH